MSNCIDLSTAKVGQNVYYRSKASRKLSVEKIGTVLQSGAIVLDFYFHYEPYVILFSNTGHHIGGGFHETGTSKVFPMTEENDLIYQSEQSYVIDGGFHYE